MKIGLTQKIIYLNGISYDSTEHGWYSYLSEHTISIIKNVVEQDFDAIADDLDCLILTGGNDPTLRRVVEIKLSTCMMQRDKPVIGICHGAFLLNELLGGTYTDDKFVDEINRYSHMDQAHIVLYNGEEKPVNSYHNMCIDNPPKTSTILAVDIDGYCESWIDGKIAAVVWHPERMEVPWLPEEIENLLKRKK